MIWNDRMRILRENSNMTLQEVADKLGVTVSTAQRYEKKDGIKAVPYEIIVKYAKIFDVSPSYIMGWDEEPRNFHYQASYVKDKLYEKILELSEGQIDRAEKVLNRITKQKNLEILSELLDADDYEFKMFLELWNYVTKTKEDFFLSRRH